MVAKRESASVERVNGNAIPSGKVAKYTEQQHIEIERELRPRPEMYRWMHCLQTGNCVIIIFTAVVLLVYSMVLFQHLPWPHSLWVSAGVYGAGLLAYSMLLCLFCVDPGKVDNSRAAREAAILPEEGQSQANPTREDGWSFCSRCKVWRPPNSHHCRTCRMCVREFDHHCGVVGRCIAERNLRWFILLLCAAAIGFFFIVAGCAVMICMSSSSNFYHVTAGGVDAVADATVNKPLWWVQAIFAGYFMLAGCGVSCHLVCSAGKPNFRAPLQFFKNLYQVFFSPTPLAFRLCAVEGFAEKRSLLLSTETDAEEQEEEEEADQDTQLQLPPATTTRFQLTKAAVDMSELDRLDQAELNPV